MAKNFNNEIIIDGIGKIRNFMNKHKKGVKYSLIVGTSAVILVGGIVGFNIASHAKTTKDMNNIDTVNEYIADYKQQINMDDLELYMDLKDKSDKLSKLPDYCEISEVLHDLKLASYDVDMVNNINTSFMEPEDVMNQVERFKELKSSTRFSSNDAEVKEFNELVSELKIQESLYNQKISECYSLEEKYGLGLAKILIASSTDDVNISDLTIHFDDWKHNQVAGDKVYLKYRVFDGKVYKDQLGCVLDINRLEIDNKLDNKIDDILEGTVSAMRASDIQNNDIKANEYNADRNRVLLNSYYVINENFAKEYAKLTDDSKKR